MEWLAQVNQGFFHNRPQTYKNKVQLESEGGKMQLKHNWLSRVMVWPPPVPSSCRAAPPHVRACVSQGYTHTFPNQGGECGAYQEEFSGVEGYLYNPAMGHPVTVYMTQKKDAMVDMIIKKASTSDGINLPHWVIWAHGDSAVTLICKGRYPVASEIEFHLEIKLKDGTSVEPRWSFFTESPRLFEIMQPAPNVWNEARFAFHYPHTVQMGGSGWADNGNKSTVATPIECALVLTAVCGSSMSTVPNHG